MSAVAVPSPLITPVNEPYWTALAEGRLTYQHCDCGHAWLPPRAECPQCLDIHWNWLTASGLGRIISWVIYHTAYHESFANALPYNVTIVELNEGPRLITNIIDCPDGKGLTMDAAVRLCSEETRLQRRTQFRLIKA